MSGKQLRMVLKEHAFDASYHLLASRARWYSERTMRQLCVADDQVSQAVMATIGYPAGHQPDA